MVKRIVTRRGRTRRLCNNDNSDNKKKKERETFAKIRRFLFLKKNDNSDNKP